MVMRVLEVGWVFVAVSLLLFSSSPSPAGVVVRGAECPAAPLQPQDRRTNTNILRIGTYNVEWLFLQPSYSNCPGSGCTWKNYTEALKHLHEVASEIIRIDADILVLEEVRECEVLHELVSVINNMTGRDFGYKPYLVRGTDTATGQNVALITRIDPSSNLLRTAARASTPVPGSTCKYTGPAGDTAVSKHFFTTIKVPGITKPILIVAAHLIAFPDRVDRCVQREGQARVMQSLLLDGLRSNYHVIATGDFNDYDSTALDSKNNMPISSVLSILRDANPSTEGDELSNAAIKINQAGRYSCWYTQTQCNPLYSMIDHMLIDNDLSKRITGAMIYHNYPAYCGGYEADHWPVVVTLSSTQTESIELPPIQFTYLDGIIPSVENEDKTPTSPSPSSSSSGRSLHNHHDMSAALVMMMMVACAVSTFLVFC